MSGTNRHRPWDKWDPVPGTKWDPPLGQTGLSLFNSTVKSPFCPVCPWDGWGFVPGTIVPQGPPEKCLCVFCLLVFFRSQKSDGYLNRSFPGVKKRGIKGEVKRGEVVGERTGPEGERGGKNEGKGVGGKGPESAVEKL